MGVSYGFDAGFEGAVAYHCAASRGFWGRIGRALDPALLKVAAARRTVEACAAIMADTGSGPGNTLLVVQRLRRWHRDGRLTLGEVQAVATLLDVMADDAPDEEQVVAEAQPCVQRVEQQRALKDALATFGKRGDLDAAIGALQGAGRIGIADNSLGTTLGNAGFAAIRDAKRQHRLPTGITDLDNELEGGLPRGSLGVVCAGTGGGKSMFLNHVAAHALAEGRFVCYATLELSEARALARLKAALLSVPTNDLLGGRDRQAKARYSKVANKLGFCFVRYFTPGVATVADVEAWVKDCERQADAHCEAVVVDYADKLSAGVRKDGEGTYSAMGAVYERLRIMAEQRDSWAWTASQPQRRWKGRKVIDTDDLADSQHKARVTDLLVTANLNEEDGDTQLRWFVAKNREGKSRGMVGPLPQDWAHGRASLDAPFIWR